MEAIVGATDKLGKFDIFQDPLSVFIDSIEAPSTPDAPSALSIFISAREKSRYTIKTGTEAGHAEGSAYTSVFLRNIFGGAESLSAHASIGTRTRSAYSLAFGTPLFSSPNIRWEIGGLGSSTQKDWASHEEALKGGATKLQFMTASGHRHEIGYSGTWRQITSLAEKASQTVRADAGDSFKSSLTHTWINDQRDYPLLPSKGYFFRTSSELAGYGPLKGDVSFAKVEAETQAAVPIPLPGLDGAAFTAGLRGGVLYPLALGGSSTPIQSRINDRFQLGGPTDVRGFRLSGLGPRDGPDAVGGDVYAAGGASLLLPFPKAGKETPLRLQAFINAGRLLPLKDKARSNKSGAGEEPMSSAQVADSVQRTVKELTNGLPSCAAGIGLVYAHPAARFEVNFSLPLVLRRGEEGRKGLSFGVGVSFL